jgi:deoxyribodipyrimidine photo-lyase
MTAILWLRRDLRIHDHPALSAALAAHDTVLPIFCLDERLLSGRHRSAPRARFLLESLRELDRALRERGSRLIVRDGLPERELPTLVRRTRAGAVHASADVGPFARARDERVQRALASAGAELTWHPGVFVVDDPAAVRTQAGGPYTVFSPFHRAWQAQPRRALEPVPDRLPAVPEAVTGTELPRPEPRPSACAAAGGEPAARERMEAFLADGAAAYARRRGRLDVDSSSRLSPYLHFGCLSARELEERLPVRAAEVRRQLCWRDFYAQLIRHHPANARSEHQRRYRGSIRWSHARTRFDAWCEGRTGYPLVDAAMRQLRAEGWIHNQSRLVVASFLTKDLGIDWRWGERWFMRLLLDGDEANNNGNWQWIASVGVDPQPPARRIYNPARRRAVLDPQGRYVRRYVPELASVPAEYLDEPWKMPLAVQTRAGCVIGTDYPAPIVDHLEARREAIARYEQAAARA